MEHLTHELAHRAVLVPLLDFLDHQLDRLLVLLLSRPVVGRAMHALPRRGDEVRDAGLKFVAHQPPSRFCWTPPPCGLRLDR